MKKIFIILLLFAFAIMVDAQTTIIDTIISGGIPRAYRLYVPAIYNVNNPVPLIINMHGYTSNASQQQSYSNFKPIADTANFLMVYPQGTLDGNGYAFWNAGINNGGVDDIGFLSHLIDTLKSKYNINLNRVYSTGLSMGGFMSHILAIALNNRIAAIASVAGTFFTYQYPYTASKAVPVMQIHGTADGTVPYAGGSNMVGVDNTVKFWVTSDHCDTTPVFTAVPNINTTDGCTAEHYVYNNGDNGSTVEFFKIIGGDHTWPGAFNIGKVTNQDMSASKEIWRFFNQYTLNPTAINEIGNNSCSNLYVYPNPAVESATLSFENRNYSTAEISVLNNMGQKVIAQSCTNGNQTAALNTTSLPAGIYLVQVLFDKKTYSLKKIVVVK